MSTYPQSKISEEEKSIVYSIDINSRNTKCKHRKEQLDNSFCPWLFEKVDVCEPLIMEDVTDS